MSRSPCSWFGEKRLDVVNFANEFPSGVLPHQRCGLKPGVPTPLLAGAPKSKPHKASPRLSSAATGGSGCGDVDGLTEEDCCSLTIQKTGPSCDTTGTAPCILSDPGEMIHSSFSVERTACCSSKGGRNYKTCYCRHGSTARLDHVPHVKRTCASSFFHVSSS